MENEFISIEFATSTIAELIGYSFHQMQNEELDETTKFLWKNFHLQLYSEKVELYKCNNERAKQIVEKVNNVYCPFLKNVLYKS